jgi:parallel beta-helix repeat protein
VEGTASTGGIVFSLTGNGHRILRNRIVGYRPFFLNGCSDCLVADNDFESNADDGLGGLWVHNASRNRIVRNRFTPHGNYGVALDGTSDYNQVQENTTGAEGPGLTCRDASSGTHNRIEPNHEAGVLKTVALKALPGKTVNSAQTAIAHGLGYAPTVVQVTPTSNNRLWISAPADGTSVYLRADADGATADVFVR